jgi:hypothetical protein
VTAFPGEHGAVLAHFGPDGHGPGVAACGVAEIRRTERELRFLCLGVASIWLTTGVFVVHPYYRMIGAGWLARLHLPAWPMFATCALEVVLAAVVAFVRPRAWLCAGQVAMIVAFTAILAVLDPMLLVHPFGMLTKNIAIVAAIVTACLVAREGVSPRAIWVLRVGMAAPWITEGLLPKLLFQQSFELVVVQNSGLVPINPALFLRILGAAQLASGVLALVLRGRPLRVLLWAQAASLVVLPILVSSQDLRLWFHPFGPFTKNVPILVGTLLLAARWTSTSSRPST